jgi:uncharacterized protein YjaG (DUF416 family)
MSAFDINIERLLTALPSKARILFAVLTAETLYPNYVTFQNNVSWGNKDLLLDATTLIYYYLINENSVSQQEIEDMLEGVNLITPDIDDFSDSLASFALDACTAIISTLEYILENDVKHITYVSSYATDTVYAYIQEKEDIGALDPSWQIQTDNDDFMIAEKARQVGLLDRLSKTDVTTISNDLINNLRHNNPIIDLSLLP